MSLDRFLRSHFWAVLLPLVAVAAVLNAQGIAELIGVRLALDAAEVVRPAPPVSNYIASTLPERVVDVNPILERNPFDHVTGALLSESSSDAGAPKEDVDTRDPWSAPTCNDVDVSAVAASDEIDWSFASVSGSDGKAHLVRRGGEIAGKKVYFIGADRLWLSSEGGLCQARLFDDKHAVPAAPAPAVSAPQRPMPSRGAPLDPDLRNGIRSVSATEFIIDRGVFDRILEDQAFLMRQARVIPVQQNGRVVGVGLMGVRPDGLLAVLGMQNGDVLQSINGFDMASPERALEAYARLRTADKMSLHLIRGGKDINLDYNIK